MEMTQLAPNVFVGAQISEEDLQRLASLGFTDVICNRPDAELPAGPTSQGLQSAAATLGIAFHYLPITPGEAFTAQAESLHRLAAKPDAKVFAYCRSGARSANAWSLAQSKQSAAQA
ncbi:TIGR01244 family sulfur transferase [Halocynthiibacter sp. C4]|nr:TIGR01244 family sulfur transferase [Halocynthiibacter sp. C4]